MIWWSEIDPHHQLLGYASIKTISDSDITVLKSVMCIIKLYDLKLNYRDFYQLPDSFPLEQILYRSEQGSRKTLYFVSPALRNIVECNSERVRVNILLTSLSLQHSSKIYSCFLYI